MKIVNQGAGESFNCPASPWQPECPTFADQIRLLCRVQVYLSCRGALTATFYTYVTSGVVYIVFYPGYREKKTKTTPYMPSFVHHVQGNGLTFI